MDESHESISGEFAGVLEICSHGEENDIVISPYFHNDFTWSDCQKKWQDRAQKIFDLYAKIKIENSL